MTKILDQTKLKAFADDKLNATKMIISVFDKVENMGKKRNCLYKQFLLFPTVFSKGSFPDPPKGVTVWEWVKHFFHRACLIFISYKLQVNYLFPAILCIFIFLAFNKKAYVSEVNGPCLVSLLFIYG